MNDAQKEPGRTIAVTILLEGTVLIGETIQFSTVLHGGSRQTFRGQVFNISLHDDGCEYARVGVLGRATPIDIRLEPKATDPAQP